MNATIANQIAHVYVVYNARIKTIFTYKILQ